MQLAYSLQAPRRTCCLSPHYIHLPLLSTSVSTSGSAAFKIRALVVFILLKRKVKSFLCKSVRTLYLQSLTSTH
jgi:hypothetical protein